MHNSILYAKHGLMLIALAVAAGCSRQEPVYQKQVVVGSETGMVHIAAHHVDELDKSATAIQKTMTDVVTALDPENKNSEVAKLNLVGDSIRLPVSRTVFRAIDLARHYSELSGGAFDITTGALTDMWKKGQPTEQERIDALAHSGQRFLEVSDTGSIALTAPGIRIHPGRFAFAFALDSAIVERRKVAQGPCMVIWPDMARRDGIFTNTSPQTIEIFSRQRIGHVDLTRQTSFAIARNDGGNSSRMYDPKTGDPASGTRLAAVIGPLTAKAYALAEALLILGRKKGAAILDAFPGYEALVIPDHSSTLIWVTPGFAEAFTVDPAFYAKVKTWEPAPGTNQLPDEIPDADFP